VIINVTGGTDLSLAEVNDASTIVQEAADEDANIIFGAVVDPVLHGKVKITVIATGFGPPASSRSTSGGRTPIDMTQYAELPRPLAVNAGPSGSAIAPRLSIARRALLDLPSAAVVGAAGSDAVPNGADLVGKEVSATASPGLEFDSGSTFDVPAFLRRQEG
jgi:cell division protein FtsZ